MAREDQLLGPPGTGKTLTLSRRVARFVDEGEYAPEDIMLTSFTRSAAAVLAGRVKVPRQNIATLHAIAFRALGSPTLAEKGALAEAWDEQQTLPAFKIGSPVANFDDGLALPDTDSGEMLRLYSLARARMVPDHHPLREITRDFATQWEAWKKEHDAYDFTDLLEQAFYAFDSLPGGQPVLIADEAQDFVPLQWAVLRHWAESCDRFVVAGDPAQLLYHFAGAHPADLSRGNIETSYTLPRSYRLPAAVQRHAEAYLRRHSTPLNLDYAPRDVEGSVEHIAATWKYPEAIVKEIEDGMHEPDVGMGGDGDIDAGAHREHLAGSIVGDRQHPTTMILATCAYMLRPTIKLLRERGIPFHNPYRRSNGSWNPLGASRPREREVLAAERDTSTVARVLAFMRGDPGWAELVQANAFAFRGGKKHATSATGDEAPAVYREWLSLEAVQAWEAGDLNWLMGHAMADKRAPLAYAAAIIERRGAEALREQPRVIVSTIHAAKGGESDTVAIFPDVSMAGWNEIHGSLEGADAAVRTGYVGLTRAKERLLLASPTSFRVLW